jgi:hypothetical protein
MADLLTLEDFQPHLTKTFKVRGGHHALALVAIEEHRVRPEDLAKVNRMPFTLIFQGPPGDLLPAGIYAVDVEGEEASYELSVMPIHTPQGDRQDYQASFN